MKGKYPFYPQLDASDCGVACLRMVAAWHGKTVSPARLRLLSHQSTRGVSLLHLAEAAEAIGFQTLAAELTLDQLKEHAPLPAILFWRGEHYVVLYALDDKKAIIGDPAEGIRHLPIEVFKKHWLQSSPLAAQAKGIVLAMEPGPVFRASEERQNGRSFARWLKEETSPWGWFRIQFWTGLVLSALLTALVPLLLKGLGDEAIHLHDRQLALLIFGAWVLVIVLRSLLSGLLDWMVAFAARRLSLSGMSQFVGRLLDLRFELLQSQLPEDLLRRAYGYEQIADFLRKRWFPAWLAGAMVVAALAVLAWLHPVLVWPLLLSLAIELGLALWRPASWHRQEDLASELEAKAHRTLADLLYGLRELKLAQGTTPARWEWERVRNEQFHLQQALDQGQRRHHLWLELVQGIRDVALVGLTTWALLQHELTVGALLAVVWIVSQLPWASRQLAQYFSDRGRLYRWFERVQEVWELPAESDADLRRDPLPERQELVLDNVTFGWKTGLESNVLEEASMRVEPGAITLVIGSSGSGKSTLIQLLAGLFPPDEGEIRYGPVTLAHVAPDLWRQKCSVLLQGGHLFQDTIANNIALGVARPDMERLRKVAQVVRLLDWIDALPLAFQTVVGQGGLGLSRGQIQQLLLARLIYRDAEIYLMDEPLFGLDGPLARDVLDNLLRFLQGKTIVIAAPHELSGLDADISYLLTRGALRVLEKRRTVKH